MEPQMYTAVGAILGALATALIGRFTVLRTAREGRTEAEKESERQRTATSREQDKTRDLQRELDQAKNALTIKAQAREHETNTWERVNEAWMLARSKEEAARVRGVAALEAMLLESELTDVVAELLRSATDDVLREAVEDLPEDGDDEPTRQGEDDDGQEDQDQY